MSSTPLKPSPSVDRRRIRDSTPVQSVLGLLGRRKTSSARPESVAGSLAAPSVTTSDIGETEAVETQSLDIDEGPQLSSTSPEIVNPTQSTEVEEESTPIVLPKRQQISVVEPTISLDQLAAEMATKQVNGTAAPPKQQSGNMIVVVRDTLPPLETRLKEHSKSIAHHRYEKRISKDELLDFIAAERLRHMPHEGGRHDRLYKMAEHFSGQVSIFTKVVQSWLADAEESAAFIYACTKILLGMFSNQSPALIRAFSVFQEAGASLAFFIKYQEFHHIQEVRAEIARAYSQLVTVVYDITFGYLKAYSSMSGTSVTLEFSNRFLKTLGLIHSSRNVVANAIWTYQINNAGAARTSGVEIRTIRDWLNPSAHEVHGHIGRTYEPEEYTCEWFRLHLAAFLKSKNEIIVATGAEGVGKSHLAAWTRDRLQRPFARRQFETLYYAIDLEVPSESSSLSVVKGLLLGFLEQAVGNVELFKSLAGAYEHAHHHGDHEHLEKSLWHSLELALHDAPPTLIILDGLSEVIGGDVKAAEVLGRIYGICSKHTTVQALVMANSLPKHPHDRVQHYTVDHANTRSDIRVYARKALLERYPVSAEAETQEIDKIATKIVELSNGNFLLADQIVTILIKEEQLSQATAALNSAPRTLHDTVIRLLKQYDSKPLAKNVLSWILVAKRPLSVREIEALLEIDPHKGNRVTRPLDVETDVVEAGNGLLVIEHRYVRTRHPALSKAIINEGKIVPAPKDGNRDLIIRALLHVKHYLTGTTEPQLAEPTFDFAEEMFHHVSLLSYTVRYWVAHLNLNNMADAKTLSLSSEFKHAMPDSVKFAMLEQVIWKTLHPFSTALDQHILTYRIRVAIFGENNRSVLQNIITIALFYQRTKETTLLAEYFYRASAVSYVVLGKYESMTIATTKRFIEVTETITITSRTEIATRREERLKILIAAYTHSHGKTDETVIKYQTELALLYAAMKETEKSSAIYKLIYELTTEKHGAHSDEAMKVSKKLTTVLSKDGDHADIVSYSKPMFEQARSTMAVTDVRRIELTFEMIATYEKQKDLHRAEELYIQIWRQIDEVYLKERTEEHYIKLLDVVLAYVAFLERHGRKEEAKSILLGIWSESEHREVSSEKVASRFIIIGKKLKEIGVASVALLVFSHVWGWFKKNKSDSKEAQESSVLVRETTREVLTTTTTTTTTTTRTISILEEVLHSSLGSSGTEIDDTTVHTGRSVARHYYEEKNWTKTITVTHEILKRLWLGFMEHKKPEHFPKQRRVETMEFVTLLIESELQLRHIEMVEKHYLYLLHAHLLETSVKDEQLTRFVATLRAFYIEHNMHEKVIDLYLLLITKYKKEYGVTDAHTITLMYTLAEFSNEHNVGDTTAYYQEIVTVLTKDSKVCHKDAMRALLFLSTTYYQRRDWKNSRSVLTLLWQTIIAKAKEYNIEASLVLQTYERYVHIEEKVFRVEHKVLYTIAMEYHRVSTTVYGETSVIAIRSTFALADVCSKHHEHEDEAIKYYEIGLKHVETNKTIQSESTFMSYIARTRSYLESLYTSHAHKKTANTEKAAAVYQQRFITLRETQTITSITVLETLRTLITLWTRDKSTEKHTQATRELQQTTVEVIRVEQDQKKLFDAGYSLGRTYIEAGLVEQGLLLLRYLKAQLISQDYSQADKAGFKLEHHHRRTYIFLAIFEETLRGRKETSFTQLMAEYLSEDLLYTHYRTTLKTSTRFDQVLIAGARLRAFLILRQKLEQVKELENELFELFIKNMASQVKTERRITFIFFTLILDELSKNEHNPNLGNAACIAGNEKIEHYIAHDQFKEAYELAQCVFQFVSAARGYHYPKNIGNGFRLALITAGRGGVKQCPDPKLYQQMLEVSAVILKDVLAACIYLKINFVQMQLTELNELVGLLGIQRNYNDLEHLLTQLWESRQSQTHWSYATIVLIGRRLVETRVNLGQWDAAAHLCRDILYNLRRVWGPTDATTLEIATLLSNVLTSAGRPEEALLVHEEILRDEVNDDDAAVITPAVAELTLTQLNLAKRAYQRAHAQGTSKSTHGYSELILELKHMFSKEKSWQGVKGVEDWSAKAPTDDFGTFKSPQKWEFLAGQDGKHENHLQRISELDYESFVKQNGHTPVDGKA